MKDQLKDLWTSHAQSFYLLTVCLLVFGILFFFTVVSNNRTQHDLDHQLFQAKTQLARQKALLPLYDDLQKKYALTIPGIKNLPDKIPLSKTETGHFESVFREMLQQCDLTLVALTPDIHSILSDKGVLSVDLTASGDFRNFKQLLMKTGQLPFLAAIDQFRIERKPGKDPLEMYLRFRLVKK